MKRRQSDRCVQQTKRVSSDESSISNCASGMVETDKRDQGEGSGEGGEGEGGEDGGEDEEEEGGKVKAQ